MNSDIVIFSVIKGIYLYNFLRKTENTLTFLKIVLQYIYTVCG